MRIVCVAPSSYPLSSCSSVAASIFFWMRSYISNSFRCPISIRGTGRTTSPSSMLLAANAPLPAYGTVDGPGTTLSKHRPLASSQLTSRKAVGFLCWSDPPPLSLNSLRPAYDSGRRLRSMSAIFFSGAMRSITSFTRNPYIRSLVSSGSSSACLSKNSIALSIDRSAWS